MPVDIQSLPSSSINTKWKETYASASLNSRPVGVVSPGIYRGLLLSVDGLAGDRTVVVSADPDKADHVAVFENEAGYSVNYRDGASGDITVSLVSYSSVDVVLTILIDYQISATTTGSFRAYTQAEFDGLTASFRGTLVVLGTVTVPASGPISAGGVSLTGRTLASANIQKGLVQNAPISRNRNFEIGETGASDKLSSCFWEKAVTVGTGTWANSTVRAESGVKSVLLSVTAGPLTGGLIQRAGVETIAGELFVCEIAVWQEETISSGVFEFFIEFEDSNGDVLSSVVADLDGGVVDVVWRTVSPILVAPTGATAVRSFGVRCTAMDPTSTGAFAYIDSVGVLVEPSDSRHPYPFDERFRQRMLASSLELVSEGGNFADKRVSIGYEETTPTGEGTVSVDPSDATDLPPALSFPGRVIDLGDGLLATAADARKARISALPAIIGTSAYTLMWESFRGGVQAMRMYTGSLGAAVYTANARWDGANWQKDVAAVAASRVIVGSGSTSLTVERQATGVDTWGDGAWTDTTFDSDQVASGAFIGTSLAARISELENGKHNVKEMWINAMAGWGSPFGLDSTVFVDASAGANLGFWESITSGATKWVTIPFPLHTGDRLLTVDVHGLAGSSAGEEIEAKLFGMNASGGPAQVSTTKTSAAFDLSVGWDVADTDFTPTGFTMLNQMYGVVVRIPITSVAAEFKLFGVQITYDHP